MKSECALLPHTTCLFQTDKDKDGKVHCQKSGDCPFKSPAKPANRK